MKNVVRPSRATIAPRSVILWEQGLPTMRPDQGTKALELPITIAKAQQIQHPIQP